MHPSCRPWKEDKTIKESSVETFSIFTLNGFDLVEKVFKDDWS